MQLNELIENETLETIASKTNLAREVIQKLVDRNCKALRRAQAMGAISIIEREYHLELADLRKECESYFATAKPSRKEGESEIVRPLAEKKRSYAKPLSLLTLLFLAGGAWYFFGNYYHDRASSSPLQAESFSGEHNVSTQAASGETNASEENGTQGEAAIIMESDTTERNDSLGGKTHEGARGEEARTSAGDLQKERNGSEQGAEILSGDGNPKGTEQNAEKEKKPIAGTAPERTLITILPEQKMWFRLTNADTKHSREFKREEKYEVPLGEHAWFFASQDSNFSIIDADMLEEYHLKGKLFLRFDKNGVHTLSEEEYRSLVK